jgi:hypothetical protein
MSELTIDKLPLDCINLIASVNILTYRAMLLIKRFALTTLDPAVNKQVRIQFTVRTEHKAMCYKWIGYKLNSMNHREDDQPAIIWADGDLEWYQYGKSHREDDLPAVIRSNGQQYWYKKGEYLGSTFDEYQRSMILRLNRI